MIFVFIKYYTPTEYPIGLMKVNVMKFVASKGVRVAFATHRGELSVIFTLCVYTLLNSIVSA